MSELLMSAMQKFNSDKRADKINLTSGVLMDDSGKDILLNTVNDVIIQNALSQYSKAYGVQTGDETYLNNVCERILGIGSNKVSFMCQTLGSSGALSLIARLATYSSFSGTVWIDMPGYVSYDNIFGRTGIKLKKYSLNRTNELILLAIDLTDLKDGDLVIIQGGCHNPTGYSLTKEDWSHLLTHINKCGAIPVLDYAYIGYDEQQLSKLDGIEAAKLINQTFFVSFSASKSFTIYNERLGALYLCTDDKFIATIVRKFCIEHISNEYLVPPTSASQIVNRIMENSVLQDLWKNELAQIRKNLFRVRSYLKTSLNPKYARHLNINDSGIFVLLPLSSLEIDDLQKKNGIHMLANGRINLSGLNNHNLEKFCKAINSL